jgi:putative FmdB family regulatory protein
VPLYEYECSNCGSFEQIRRFSDPPLEACPKCNGPVEKLLSAPAFQFKGTGWYVTDYARKGAGGNGEGKSKNGEDKSASSSSSSPSTETSASTSTAESKSPSTGDGSTKTAA